MSFVVSQVCEENMHVYLNLAQAYEAEFSRIINKRPDASGVFPLDTELGGDVNGFLLYIDDCPAGMAAIAVEQEYSYEVCEFYVLPVFRQKKAGQRFASQLFDKYLGRWVIKQVEGADHALQFWRKVIDRYTGGCYRESQFDDSQWGRVTCQTFEHREFDCI